MLARIYFVSLFCSVFLISPSTAASCFTNVSDRMQGQQHSTASCDGSASANTAKSGNLMQKMNDHLALATSCTIYDSQIIQQEKLIKPHQ